jgi:hypothetical protein
MENYQEIFSIFNINWIGEVRNLIVHFFELIIHPRIIEMPILIDFYPGNK